MKTLVFHRLDTLSPLRRVSVFVDERKIGSLGFAAVEQYEIPESSTEVYVSMGGAKSRSQKLDTPSNMECFFVECNGGIGSLVFRKQNVLGLHPIKQRDLPTPDELFAFKKDFKRVAGISIIVLLLFGFFLGYSLYVAIVEQQPLWYLLSAISIYNMYKIGARMYRRALGKSAD